MKKNITIVVAAALLLIMSTGASANVNVTAAETTDAASSATLPKLFRGGIREDGGLNFVFEAQTEEELAVLLAEAVANGKITQEQADKILAKRKEISEGLGELKNGFGFGTRREPMTEEELAAKLAEEVASGKITQEQADKIIAKQKEMSERLDELKGGTEGGIRNIREPITEEELAAKLAEDVADGKITQEQADKIIAAHKEMLDNVGNLKDGMIIGRFSRVGEDGFEFGFSAGSEEEYEAKLAEAVAEGKLTQEQADEILSKHRARQENFEALKNGTFDGIPMNPGKPAGRSRINGDATQSSAERTRTARSVADLI